MNNLMEELKLNVLERLNIKDISPEEIDGETPMIGEGLGIDSIDILELVIMIEEDYGIKIDNKELGAKVFRTFGTMVEYIAANRKK